MKILLLILVVAGTGAGLVQHGKIRTVRAQIQSHQASFAEVQTLSTQLDRAQPVALTEAQIASLRAERSELLQLRANLPKLREQARSTNEIAAEIEKLNAAALRDKQTARALEVTFVEEQRSKAIRGTLDQFRFCLDMIRRGAQQPLPRSAAEMETILAGEGDHLVGARHLWTNLSRSFPPFNISRESFEFIPEASPSGSPLLLRERLPHKLPDGQWSRYYLRNDFQSVQILQPTEDFSAWEARQ